MICTVTYKAVIVFKQVRNKVDTLYKNVTVQQLHTGQTSHCEVYLLIHIPDSQDHLN